MRKIQIFSCLLCLVLLVGCSSEDEASPQEKSAVEGETNSGESMGFSQYDNSALYPIVAPAWNYASKHEMKIYDFKEREEVFNLLDSKTENDKIENAIRVDVEYLYDEIPTSTSRNKSQVPMQRTQGIAQYKKTTKESKLRYYGEFDDEARPNGLGVIFHFESPYQELDDFSEKEAPTITIQYAGYFQNGKYDGYGIDFGNASGVTQYKAFIANNALYNGREFYEGNFENGFYQGNANYFKSYFEQAISSFDDDEKIDPLKMIYDVGICNFEKGLLNGTYQFYYNGSLQYDGDTKNGTLYGFGKLYNPYTKKLLYEGDFVDNIYSGEGSLYSEDTGTLLYKGAFKHNVYNGNGILYDQNGKTIHEGVFENGDIK